jgi:hypothetical protein
VMLVNSLIGRPARVPTVLGGSEVMLVNSLI